MIEVGLKFEESKVFSFFWNWMDFASFQEEILNWNVRGKKILLRRGSTDEHLVSIIDGISSGQRGIFRN